MNFLLTLASEIEYESMNSLLLNFTAEFYNLVLRCQQLHIKLNHQI